MCSFISRKWPISVAAFVNLRPIITLMFGHFSLCIYQFLSNAFNNFTSFWDLIDFSRSFTYVTSFLLSFVKGCNPFIRPEIILHWYSIFFFMMSLHFVSFCSFVSFFLGMNLFISLFCFISSKGLGNFKIFFGIHLG
jgi:hypothetical protein